MSNSDRKFAPKAIVIDTTDGILNFDMYYNVEPYQNRMRGYCGSGTAVTITFDGKTCYQNAYRWMCGTGAANYDVQLQVVSGVGTLSGSAANTWLRLNTNPGWALAIGGAGLTRTKTGWLRFRSNATQQEITSANVSFSFSITNSTTGTKTGDTK